MWFYNDILYLWRMVMKKIFNTIPFVLVSILGGISMSAIAVELPARGPIPFANYDLDKNGSISEQEFNKIRSEHMAAKSTQGRGMKGMANAPSFSAFDLDGNGQLTQQELLAGQQAQMQSRQSNRGQGVGMGQGRGQRSGMSQGKNMPSFSDFDLNDDGIILKDEFYQARAERVKERAEQGYPMKNIANAPAFEDVDINGDKKVSSKEFAEHQNKHRKQMMKN
jgi:Ca2+-binding EF-hand superfamily protein